MLIANFREREKRRLSNRQRALRFLATETWTSIKVLGLSLGGSISAVYKIVSQLQRDGLVRTHRIEDLRMTVVGVTALGITEAAIDNTLPINLPTFRPNKIRPVSVAHRIELQIARIGAENSGWHDWTLARSLPKTWKNRPDAIAMNPSGDKIAIELERIIKSRRRYEVILSNHLQAITKGHYREAHYVCKDRTTAASIDRMFRSISRVPVGYKRVTLSSKHRARVPIFALQHWPIADADGGKTW